MAKLSDFPKPVSAPEVAAPDWLSAPCGMTRDSDPLTRSNFDALCDRLDTADPYGDDWEIVRFGHFAVGWIEEIFVLPGSKCADICADVRGQMAVYPCLDEALWVEYDEASNAP